MEDKNNVADMVVEIISAFVSNNPVPSAELPQLISSVHKSLISLRDGDDSKAVEPQTPAVSVKKSIASDYIVCLEDGRKFKSLKRHLRTKYNMTPDDYRAKWNLPKDYPMVAPAYAAARSNLAKQMGLGQSGRGAGQAQARKKSKASAA